MSGCCETMMNPGTQRVCGFTYRRVFEAPGGSLLESKYMHLGKIVHDALTGLGKALGRLGQGITEPFDTAGENLKKEFQKVDYKRAVDTVC